MEATIFVLSSLATNLAGIYWHVPFTVVDPHHTFLERLVGSVQVSSTIYTLRYWHPLVFPEFPEAAKCESPGESPCGSPAQNISIELSDMLRNVMDQYVQKPNLTTPCPTNIGNSCGDQPPPLTTIHHTLFGRTFDIPLDQNSADLYWTVFFTTLVLIAIILMLWKGFTQGNRKHDTDATSGQKSDKSADLPSEKEALNWIRIARFAVALRIKDDISHDSLNIRAKITEIPDNLRQFQRILQSDPMLAESKEGDDVETNKMTLAQVFDGHLWFCTEAVKSALEVLNQLSRRVDHRINLHEQPLDGYGHGQGDQKLEDPTDEFSLYQQEFLTKDTLEATTSAMEKRILGTVDDHIAALDEEAKKRIGNIESALANISALHEEAKRQIDNIESALAKVQQSLSVGVVDQEQLNETIGGLKADMGNLRTSLQSLSRESNDSQVGVDTIVHEQLQSLEKRVRSLERAASVTPLDKKQIEQELDELDQAVISLKNSHAEIQSKLDSTVTETQVKEALKQIAAHLEQQTEGMKNQLHGLMEALDEVKNAATKSKNNDSELANQLEDIERAIGDSAKEVQSFRKELDTHALEHKSLREAVNRALEWNKELEDGIKQKISRVTRNILETNARMHISTETKDKLEEYKWHQRNMNLSIWGHLHKCMDALDIKFDLSAADLVTVHDRNHDPAEKPESNDEHLAAEHGAHKTDVVDEGPSQDEAQAAGFEAESPREKTQPTKDEAGSPKGEAQKNEPVQTSDDQRRASAESGLIRPRSSKPAPKAISSPKQSPVAGRGDEAAEHDKVDTAQSRAEHNQEGEKGRGSAALGTHKETIAQPKASVGTQSPQTPGFAKGKSSGKHAPEPLRLKTETSTSTRHEKGQASAQSPSKPNTEPTSAELSESRWAPSTATQAQPKTSEGTQSPQTPGSAKGKSSKKHTPRTPGLNPEASTFSATREKSKGAGAASAQSPSKSSTESASAEMSKSRWASTPTQTQSRAPTHGGTKGDQPASPASAQGPPKLAASPSAEMSKSRWADSSQKASPASAQVPKLAAPASAEMGKSRWADPTLAKTQQPNTPTPAGVEGSQLAGPASGKAPPKLDAEMSKSKWANPASAQEAPSKPPTSAGLSKSRWADDSPTAQRSKSVSLPSEKNPKGDLGETF
ncbi:hypothetical protein CNMCM8980_009035 [Aspergillus fumigatiaffinis]|jgi:predicted  nucleic acid-binding Zn-ribbon protein|uniref:Uncharacterized protein n=1 Tax=Aspergillus fumigatiaffinis TaxID=340414 RepID=A0A8H4M4Y8_9EURO|nr:hypothetical protein CNMCM5878_004767 [Aspergillus fumigatiaffinis]KAF4228441.1 hypothetical protein CNMCM6457_006906 [Aspergillus fumigatiaffinis]KAF4244644.1 hypothetical protein CNMCM6805_008042 [Aspergillus fumigatiaffinis]KAF4251114.1 hypothetical protein CNMCM8980_009035 [Aspergillus fumigatiaffinis]